MTIYSDNYAVVVLIHGDIMLIESSTQSISYLSIITYFSGIPFGTSTLHISSN